MPPYPSNLTGGASVSASGAAGLLGLAAAAGAPSSLITPSSSHFHAIKDEKGLSLTIRWSVCYCRCHLNILHF